MYLNGFVRAEQEVITMDYRGAIPIYGTYVNYQKITDESLSFDERAHVAIGAGVMGGIHMILATELGFVSLGQVRVMQAAAAYAPLSIMTATLAASTYAATKKGATVEHGPFGSVSITPSLGVF